MVLIPLLLAAAPTAATALAIYRERTAATVRCRAQPSDSVVVCARRAADRYRVPLVVPPDPGDPRHEGVHAERERLFARTTQCQEKTPFLVGCGSVGVHMTTGGGRTRFGAGEREIAP